VIAASFPTPCRHLCLVSVHLPLCGSRHLRRDSSHRPARSSPLHVLLPRVFVHASSTVPYSGPRLTLPRSLFSRHYLRVVHPAWTTASRQAHANRDALPLLADAFTHSLPASAASTMSRPLTSSGGKGRAPCTMRQAPNSHPDHLKSQPKKAFAYCPLPPCRPPFFPPVSRHLGPLFSPFPRRWRQPSSPLDEAHLTGPPMPHLFQRRAAASPPFCRPFSVRGAASPIFLLHFDVNVAPHSL
jgi:hypothetical protein